MSEISQQLQSEATSLETTRRRRLLVGGALSGGFAVFKSGSALAGGTCSSPSAFGSISHASHRPQDVFTGCQPSSKGVYTAPGRSRSNSNGAWGLVSQSQSTLGEVKDIHGNFLDKFPSKGNWTFDTKLLDVLSSLWVPDGNLVVLYLDVKTGRAGSALTVDDVFDMWRILFDLGTSNPKFNGWTDNTVRNFYSSWVGNA